MNPVIQNALEKTLSWIGDSVQFWTGLVSVVSVALLTTVSGELIDDLTTYKAEEVPWPHIIKVVAIPVSAAVLGYLNHRRILAQALNSPMQPGPALSATSELQIPVEAKRKQP